MDVAVGLVACASGYQILACIDASLICCAFCFVILSTYSLWVPRITDVLLSGFFYLMVYGSLFPLALHGKCVCLACWFSS